MILGADGVQLGSRFVASEEGSAHINFNQSVIQAKEGDTELTLKELTPVRLMKNKFYHQLQQLYSEGASVEDLKAHLGRARAKRGMFEGDLDEGELEIGQVAGIIDQIKPAGVIVQDLMGEYQQALATLPPDFKSWV